MSARTMALKYATRTCPLNKVPNTRRGSRLDPGFNYVNLTDAQLHEIRIRKDMDYRTNSDMPTYD
jgi:hypothetical protein